MVLDLGGTENKINILLYPLSELTLRIRLLSQQIFPNSDFTLQQRFLLHVHLMKSCCHLPYNFRGSRVDPMKTHYYQKVYLYNVVNSITYKH